MNKWQKQFPDSHNLSIFLLEIADCINSYLIDSNMNFVTNFASVCQSNPLFLSRMCHSSKENIDQNQIFFETTQDFLNSLYILSDYMECACHDKSLEEYKKEVKQVIKKYLGKILILLDQITLSEHAIVTSTFFEDCQEIIIKLKNNNNLSEAEKSLLAWKDAIPDIVVQNALINLHFSYLKNSNF